MKYAFMRQHDNEFYVTVMARLFEVSLSGYKSWCKRQPSKRAIDRKHLALLIRAQHEVTHETYSAVRMHEHLQTIGHRLSLHQVRSIRQQDGIYCKRHKKFKVTTNSNHDKPVFDNILNQQFMMTRPNQAWVSDITYIWTEEGWLYLAGVKDLYTKELVGYCLSKRMTAEIVIKALEMGVRRRRPTKGLIVHSDRGSQYCSNVYRQMVKDHGFVGSMSKRGCCYDNAPIESFWGTLKNELIYHKHYETRQEVITEVTQYIEIFYNRQRIQAKIGYQAPAKVFEDYFKMVS
jgi:putative transposase